ncbi:MAG: GAF domain-containing protein [Chloroflexi bacterium]|nr:GAF domain-containing protein [Chloroflexota bacterium]
MPYDKWLSFPRGLTRLREGAEHWASGDWSYRTRLRGSTDLEELGAAYDKMADQLERAIKELEEQARRREALLAVACQFAREATPDHVLDELLAKAEVVVGGDSAAFSRWAEGESGYVLIRHTLPHVVVDRTIGVGQGVAGQVIARREPVIMNEYAASPHATRAAVAHGIQAAIGVPLISDEVLVGALAVFSHVPGTEFSSADVETLRLLAEIAAATLAGLELAQQKKEAAISDVVRRYANTIPHELNQSLSVIIGYGELIGSREWSTDRMRTMATGMAEASRELAERIRKFSQLETYRTREFGGSELIALDPPEAESVT